MQKMIKVGSIIEILEYNLEGYGFNEQQWYLSRYPVGSKHTVLAFHPETGEIELCHEDPNSSNMWITFFPGEYKLVE